MALVIAPLMIASYVIGLPYGPKGVAFAYSAVMTLWVIPVIAWAVHGTVISFQDILRAASYPLASVIIAVAFSLGLRPLYAQTLPPLPRLLTESVFLFVAYTAALLLFDREKSLYLNVLRGFKTHSSAEEKSLVSI